MQIILPSDGDAEHNSVYTALTDAACGEYVADRHPTIFALPHDSVFTRGESGQDLFYKFILPSQERDKVLR
jgi:hypothetical protein